MTTSTLIGSDELTIVKLLAAGRSINFVATAVDRDETTVRRVGENHGWPDTDKLAWAVDELEKAAATEQPARPPARPAAATAPAPRPTATPRPVAVAPAASTGKAAAPSDRLADLLRRAAASPKTATRRQGEKLRDLAAALEQRLDDEAKHAAQARREQAAREAAQARIRELEQQLAAARAALPGAKPKTKRPSRPVPPPRLDYDPAVVRAWAREQGIACGPGRFVKREIVAAWRDATQGGAA